RLRQESTEQLRRWGTEGRGLRRRAEALRRRVEGDLLVVHVEEVLAPEFEAPAPFRPRQADAGIDHHQAALFLLQIEVRAGVDATLIAIIHIEEPAEAGRADLRRPCRRTRESIERRIGQARTRQLEESRVK